MKLSKKVEIYLFIILLFLQNYAIITTNNFGINGLVMYMILLSFLNFKSYYGLVNRKFLTTSLIVIAFLFISCLLNGNFYFTQLFRVFMIIWLVYISYIYLKNIYNNNNQDFFWKAYYKIFLILMLYGLYEFVALHNNLPLFLNIFSNNPSYTVRSFYDYFSGWNQSFRLYNVFFEPSIFSLFLAYNFFLLKENKYVKNSIKKVLYILILFNLYFSYARTGWVSFIYMFLIYILYKLIIKKKNNIFDFLILLMPFINIAIMYYVGGVFFGDLSYISRTKSSLYYLNGSFDSLKHIIFGHGCGSLINTSISLSYIGKSAQNGYCDFLYQYGLTLFLFLFVILIKKINKVSTNKTKYLAIGSVGLFCCFGNYFMVETMVVLLVLILIFCEGEKNGES